MIATFTMVLLVCGSTRASDASGGGLTLVGTFDWPQGKTNGGLSFIDPEGRRLFARIGASESLGEFDLRQPVPTLVRTVPYPVEDLGHGFSNNLFGPNTITVDNGRRTAYFIDYLQPGSSCPYCLVIKGLDLQTLKVGGAPIVVGDQLPNYFAEGITYAPQDDVIYAVGTLLGYPTSGSDTYVRKPTYPVTIVALDPSSKRLLWARTLVECQRPLSTQAFGASLFRSHARRALYVPCIRPDTLGLSYPGESGIVRVSIDPQATTETALAFRTEFFAISGVYTGGRGVEGQAVYDPASDRIFMLSQSPTTPGAWVFDGHLSAWVGFIPASDETDVNIGLDPSTGHVFIRSGANEEVIVSDGRATPVPQGVGYQLPIYKHPITGYYLVDPISHRVFSVASKPSGLASHVLVLRDGTPDVVPPSPTDYDSLTLDIPEGEHTQATYAGSVRGFGVRAVLVGGYGGVLEPLDHTTLIFSVEIPGVSPGDRGVTLGSVPSLDMRNVGAAAAAQAVAPDALTGDDHRNQQNTARQSAGDQVGDLLAWPWPALACLDGSGDRIEDDDEGAASTARIRCDLEEGQANASAFTGPSSIGPVSIARASFEGGSQRSVLDGTVTTADAAVRGLKVNFPGVGQLSIGEITSTARTVAHGRPGTARVEWHRTIENVAIQDADGADLFRCPEMCSPGRVADQVNDLLGLRLRMTIPRVSVRTTPGGAFAGVQETKGDFSTGLTANNDPLAAVPAVELIVYNDRGEKSRLHLQLAALQASSIYGISLLPQARTQPGPTDPTGPLTPGIGGPESIGGAGPAPSYAPPASGGTVPRLVQTALLMVRSPKDGLMVALTFLLIGAPVAAAWRRRSLLRVLEDGASAT